MRMREWMGAALATTLMAVPAAAQADGCELQALQAARKAGSYAEYKITGGEAPGALRLTLIGNEKKGTVGMQRIELQLNSPRLGGPVVMQMLVPEWPFESSEIGEMIMQAPGQPAMRMPAQMMAMMNRNGGSSPALEIDKSCRNATLVGAEKVTVAAGSFDTKHYRNAKESADLWISPAVGGWGLVKLTMPGTSMELTASGSNGKSALVGTPIDMPGMPGQK